MPEERVYQVGPAQSGVRLDSYLTHVLPELSRSQLQRLIKGGHVRMDGEPVVHQALRLGAVADIAVSLPDALFAEPAPVARPDLPIFALYADGAVIVVDKPAGQVVHPAKGHLEDTLVNALVAQFPDLAPAFAATADAVAERGRAMDQDRAGIVHRLDRDTSGIMVVARTVRAAANLERQFAGRTVEKVYLALVKGVVALPEGVIDAPIGRDTLHRKRMALAADGRAAQTTYRLLQALPDAGYSWLEVRPRTGRTHQIRVHMAAIGHPVSGDVIYGKPDPQIGRLALHAWQLAFDHPTTGARMQFSAALPDDLRMALAAAGVSAGHLGMG